MFSSRPIRHGLPGGRSMTSMFGSTTTNASKTSTKSATATPPKSEPMSTLWRAAPIAGRRK
jgi:hypothetical protein